MAAALDILSWICIVGGAFFCVVGGLGLVRLPDFYTRGHAAGVTDTMGAGLMLLGLMFQTEGVDVAALGHALAALDGHHVADAIDLNLFKLLGIMAFLLITSPTSGHALGKAAFTQGLKPYGVDDLPAADLPGVDLPGGGRSGGGQGASP